MLVFTLSFRPCAVRGGCFGVVAGFGGEGVAGCGAFAAVFGPAGAGPGGFGNTGGRAQAGADVAEPAADSSGGERAAGVRVFLPGAAEVGGEGAGEAELGVRGHDDLDPAAGLFGGSGFGGGEARGRLAGLVGVL